MVFWESFISFVVLFPKEEEGEAEGDVSGLGDCRQFD